ncbi:flagellar motor stator protein MotA [Virgibacillus senegalensis]|uniref:flagellar motor stator protein MotA n=1 Tax=Virgibacillus senegalensis TaxID=1499679 RepID=UPI00069F88EE|nr:flagellar motor stator protein MotA [Virgibacillus senegalensis]
MDKTSFGGILLAIIAVGVGMILKGVSPMNLLNPAALLIIFLGTVAAVCIAFPFETLKKVPALFKIIFTEQKTEDVKDIIPMFTDWANLTRREGILALENHLDEIEDPFLASGLELAVDGQTPEFIRDVLLEKIDAIEERHHEGASIFTQAGTYAPTLGVLGAVIGLIAALGNMEDTEALGHAIAAAFVATLFGIFSGYVLWHPFANKLKEKSRKELHVKRVMIEGILSLTTGDSSQVIQGKLSSYLSPKEFAAFEEGEPQ